MNSIPITYRKTQIENVEVSTIIMAGASGNPVAETMIFLDPGPDHGLREGDGERTTADEAGEQHADWVSKVSAAVYA